MRYLGAGLFRRLCPGMVRQRFHTWLPVISYNHVFRVEGLPLTGVNVFGGFPCPLTPKAVEMGVGALSELTVPCWDYTAYFLTIVGEVW